MSQTLNRRSIANALQRFENGNLAENTRRLLEILDYRSDRTIALEPNTVEGFIEIFDQLGGINSDKAQLQEWESIDFLFQLTEAEIVENTQLQIDFEDYSVDDRIIESYLFFVLRLRGSSYTGAQLSQITRAINQLTPIPAMVFFQYDSFLAWAIIDRRPSKRDLTHDVLEKITLIKDIDYTYPDDAHVEILHNFSLDELCRRHQIRSFLQFHQAWQETLDRFNPSELKPHKSEKRRYDRDKYPSEEIADIYAKPYKVISEVFDYCYEDIYDDVEDEMDGGHHDREDGIIGQLITCRRPRY